MKLTKALIGIFGFGIAVDNCGPNTWCCEYGSGPDLNVKCCASNTTTTLNPYPFSTVTSLARKVATTSGSPASALSSISASTMSSAQSSVISRTTSTFNPTATSHSFISTITRGPSSSSPNSTGHNRQLALEVALPGLAGCGMILAIITWYRLRVRGRRRRPQTHYIVPANELDSQIHQSLCELAAQTHIPESPSYQTHRSTLDPRLQFYNRSPELPARLIHELPVRDPQELPNNPPGWISPLQLPTNPERTE